MVAAPAGILRTVFLSLLVSVVPASAVERNQAIEKCRNTVGKPIVTACMHRGGSLETCRESARPEVQLCVKSAMGFMGGVRCGTPQQKVSGAACH